MQFLKLFVSVAALAIVCPQFAQADTPAQLSEAESAEIQGALDRGQLLYAYDQAAWHTTDAMLKDIGDPAGAGIRGWIVNDAEDGLEVVFMRQAEDGFEAVWSGVYSRQKVRDTKTYQPGERPFTKAENALALASKIPLDEERQRCSRQPVNTVVFPSGKDDGGLFVYYLVPQQTISDIPLGGHYRYEVVDGKIVASRKFTNSCISLNSGEINEDQRLASLMISHLLDDVPTEIHVFSMFASGLPLVVSTIGNERLWVVEAVDGQAQVRVLQ